MVINPAIIVFNIIVLLYSYFGYHSLLFMVTFLNLFSPNDADDND